MEAVACLKFCQGSGPMGKKGPFSPFSQNSIKFLRFTPVWIGSHHTFILEQITPVARRANFRRPAHVFYLLELIMDFSLNHMD